MSATLAELQDYSTFPGGTELVDMTPRRITGARVVVEWVARAWLTRAASLEWATARGVDVRDLENATLGKGDAEAWRGVLAGEARKTPFVRACAVAVTLEARTITIDGRLVLVDGGTYPLAIKLSEAAKLIKLSG